MPECKEGQEFNHRTNRCRKITCKKGDVYSDKKKKCVKKRCEKGKILSKSTNRCVKKTLKCKKGQQFDKQKNICVVKTCEPGKILNPKTMRCVKEKRNLTQKKKPTKNIKIHQNLEDNRVKMRPPKRILLKEILDNYKNMNSKEVVPYGCFDVIEHLMLLHVLRKNKNDCAYNIELFGNLQAGYKKLNYSKYFKDHIREHYQLCKSKNKMLVVPLNIMGGRHANVLIFNPFRNEVERFEPHGKQTGSYSFDDKRVNMEIEKFVNKIDSGLKFISPNLLCPRNYSGYQHYEQDAKKEKGVYNNVAIEDARGYCCAWSYFYVDMRLKFPKKSGTEIIKESQDILGYNPNELRQFIRGQVAFLGEELNAINKKYKFETLINKKNTGRLLQKDYLVYKEAWNDAIYNEFKKFHSQK